MDTLTEDANVHAALIEVAEKQNIQTAAFELLGGLREEEFLAHASLPQPSPQT